MPKAVVHVKGVRRGQGKGTVKAPWEGSERKGKGEEKRGEEKKGGMDSRVEIKDTNGMHKWAGYGRRRREVHYLRSVILIRRSLKGHTSVALDSDTSFLCYSLAFHHYHHHPNELPLLRLSIQPLYTGALEGTSPEASHPHHRRPHPSIRAASVHFP